MPQLEPAHFVFLGGVGLFTLLTAFTDLWLWKVPNKLTLPMFVLGFVYQGAFHGWNGLLDGTYAFLIGFTTFFIFWTIGISGGGDVKLVGALSVWLGMKLILPVLTVTTALVALIHAIYIVWTMVTKGMTEARKMLRDNRKPSSVVKPATKDPQQAMLLKRVQGRVLMGYAVPVAMATWSVVLWKLL